jgi:proteasome lid subunit RPN8/RPN11
VRIPASIRDEIVAHSKEDLPDECCGLVGGRDGAATTLYRATNRFASPLRYEVDPGDLIRIMGEIDSAGEELVAIYHSHTKSEAYPSQTDINLARNWPDPVYLICSLGGEEPVLRGFILADGKVEEVGLVFD